MELITTVISSSTVASHLYSTFQCGQLITTPTWYIDGTKTISTSGQFTGLASGLWVEWEKRDLYLFNPASAPILGYAHFEGNHTSTSSTSVAHPSSGRANGTSSGLSVAAKAGIGVAVGVVFLMLLGISLLWIRRLHQRRQSRKMESKEEAPKELDPSGTFVEAPNLSKRYEADGSFTYAEKRIEDEVVELDGNWCGHEVADTSGRSEKESASRSSSIVPTPAQFFRPSSWL